MPRNITDTNIDKDAPMFRVAPADLTALRIAVAIIHDIDRANHRAMKGSYSRMSPATRAADEAIGDVKRGLHFLLSHIVTDDALPIGNIEATTR